MAWWDFQFWPKDRRRFVNRTKRQRPDTKNVSYVSISKLNRNWAGWLIVRNMHALARLVWDVANLIFSIGFRRKAKMAGLIGNFFSAVLLDPPDPLSIFPLSKLWCAVLEVVPSLAVYFFVDSNINLNKFEIHFDEKKCWKCIRKQFQKESNGILTLFAVLPEAFVSAAIRPSENAKSVESEKLKFMRNVKKNTFDKTIFHLWN